MSSMRMTTARFNELLNGPLAHPIPTFARTRLAMALWSVVDATGAAGAQALEQYCVDALDPADDDDHEEDEAMP